MKIIYNDGREQECREIYFSGKACVVDGIYVIPYTEMLKVVDK